MSNDDEEVEDEDKAGNKRKPLRIAYVVHALGRTCREDEKKDREYSFKGMEYTCGNEMAAFENKNKGQ